MATRGCTVDQKNDGSLKNGDKVTHPTLGVGKVVSTAADLVRIYFKQPQEPVPDRRVKKFKLPAPMLTPTGDLADAELDNLPPWSDERFQQFQTPLTLDAAKARFLEHFPDGLDDPQFHRRELDYKRSAHRRFVENFRSNCDRWIASGDAQALASGLNEVYGNPKVPEHKPDSRLNILYQRAEEPAYFDALSAAGAATVEFVAAALDFIDKGTRADFNRYADALARLPTRSGGFQLDKWTALTWLPFIAAPARHFVIKPTIVRAFSSALPHEITYQAQPNFITYTRVVDMAHRVADVLASSELNLRRRKLDFIDVQSFMWAVERYGKSGA